MKIAIGSDHAGYNLKEELKKHLEEKNVEVEDFGAFSTESCDYPDVAREVAEAVAAGSFEKGVLCCGTGIGVCMTANKVRGIRAARCHDVFSARASRQHNDANVITMGERVVGKGLAVTVLDAWLEADFEGGRHQRRVDKIAAVGTKHGK